MKSGAIESAVLLEPGKSKKSPMRARVMSFVWLVGALGFLGLAQTKTREGERADGVTEGDDGGFSGHSTMDLAVFPSTLVDPETSKVEFTLFALGDWGGTLGKEKGDPGSCCHLYNGGVDKREKRYKVDFYSQEYVAALMAKSAEELHPLRILGHGDNFYWNGVGTEDAKYRFEETFEKVYDAPSLKNIPWVNVVGNHDIGGATFICGEKDGAFRECESEEELLRYLDIRFEAQSNYTSPNNNRWILRGHYYVEHVEKNGVSVDIFNVDTNHADNHGGKDVCCQCYGYTAKLGINNGVCNYVEPGDLGCVGGNRTLYEACYNKINSWAEESLKRAMVDIAASKATFKIINTHYSPHYHMDKAKMEKWYKLTREAGVSAWLNGHTHGFNHAISKWGTHFFENGGGGGYFTGNNPKVDNGKVKSQWVVSGNPYGFFELSFSKDWMKIQFATFDDSWEFGGLQLNNTVVGGVQRGHCWHIPRTHRASKGIECKSSINGAVGAPLD